MTRSVLIIGGKGQLGSDIAVSFTEARWRAITLGVEDCDVRDTERTARILRETKPTLVVNTAWCSVRECESDPIEAFTVNAIAAGNVASVARSIGAQNVYVSTDYIFDGKRKKAYRESDLPSPLNVYGASKLSGEHLVRMADSRAIVIRTSALFGVHASQEGNFALRMIAAARQGNALRYPKNQWTVPTSTADVSRALLRLVERSQTGIWHIVSRGGATWYDIALAVKKYSGLSVPVLEATNNDSIPRPEHSVLSPRSCLAQGIELPHWRSALRAYVENVCHDA